MENKIIVNSNREHDEYQYLELISNIILNGERRSSRNGSTLSIFGEKLVFHVSIQGFPIITTKKVFWRGIVEELLWFLRGSTDVSELQSKNIHIWDANSTREFLDSVGLTNTPANQIGAGYGYQWRCFGGDYPSRENGIDQLKFILNELSTNPHGRRAVLSAWNPKQLSQAALPPCHFTYVFYINANGLSCQMQMRSCDVCAGLPFNIASTALLTSILAYVLRIPVDRIIIITGDTHIYESHTENTMIQIDRDPYPFPKLNITKEAPTIDSTIDEKIKWIESLEFTDFTLENYKYHPSISFPMVA
uniref:thymidylate synthase n=1 Tax=viral metagenome TaxID=1070528 RepID=A0A6C0KWP9_9ZZZZ